MDATGKRLNVVAWSLSVVTSALALIAWGQGLSWQFSSMSLYYLFPLFGLIAFGLMWSHYLVAAFRLRYNIDRVAILKYFHITSLIVLVAILTHPILLIWQLWHDGFGLPPFSYHEVYGWLALLGTVSLLIFLSFELRRWFDRKSWWWIIERINDIAMIAIYYHGLKLGSNLQSGWFRYVWYFYGISLLGTLVYIYHSKIVKQPERVALAGTKADNIKRKRE